jgi:acyl-CoA dehydrogenase
MSRLSHGVRATAMIRRCVNEALAVASNREAFGEIIIEKPLLRRQLMKIIVPAEQALSMAMYTGQQLELSDAGDKRATELLRILTPLLKFLTCRDNISVATGAMEVRGGNGYTEDWVNSRLVRDAHLGVLWEGTSNINALEGHHQGRRGAERSNRRHAENPRSIPGRAAEHHGARARRRRGNCHLRQ